MRALTGLVVVAAALALPAVARADLADERALAERFAPVVRLVEQEEECGPGESWEPTDVDVLFEEPTVALRGPWNPTDLVRIGPSADDLVDRFDLSLDLANQLQPVQERQSLRLVIGDVRGRFRIGIASSRQLGCTFVGL